MGKQNTRAALNGRGLLPAALLAVVLAAGSASASADDFRTLSSYTVSGMFEGFNHDDGGQQMQILKDDGERQYIHCSEDKITDKLRNSAGLKIKVSAAQISTCEDGSDSEECLLDIVKDYQIGKGKADKELNSTRIKAEGLDPDAANRLGVWYEKGKHGLPKDPKEAVRWYLVAAESDHALAIHNLGDCYRDGVGVAKDCDAAFNWYKKNVDLGNAIGFEDVGNCYLTGCAPEQNWVEARKYYRKALSMGRKNAAEKLKIINSMLKED